MGEGGGGWGQEPGKKGGKCTGSKKLWEGGFPRLRELRDTGKNFA